MKKLLPLALILMLCLLTCPACTSNHVKLGPNLGWKLTDADELIIAGKGDMIDFGYSSAPWRFKDPTKVTVMDGVTSISDEAFYWCDEVTTVSLPETVTKIGKQAFYWCEELETVNIPSGVTVIEEDTFRLCESLTELILPQGLRSIGDGAFHSCRSLREMVIPASVSHIGNNAFGDCVKLERITVEDGNPNYVSVDGVLYTKDMTTLLCYPAAKAGADFIIPDTVTTIADYCFYENTSLRRVTVPGSVKTIGNFAFNSCHSLEDVTLSEGIVSVGWGVFSYCASLESIHFPASVRSIDPDAFDSAPALTEITVDPACSAYTSEDGVLFTKNRNKLVAYPSGRKDVSYIVPEGVMTIGECAFQFNENLMSVTFPDSLKIIDEDAFSRCEKLTEIHFGSQLSAINDYAFSFCDSLTSVVIPESVQILGSNAFGSCENLVSVTVLNPAASFDDYGVFDTGSKALRLTGYANSTTQAHAEEEGIPFVALDDGGK